MATKITLEYCGMSGEGETVAKAKADAARKLTQLVEELANGPTVLELRDVRAIVWRTAYGWSYQVVTGVGSLGRGTLNGCQTNGDLAETCRSAVQHMADYVWTIHEDDAALAVETVAALPWGVRASGASIPRELCDRWQWQRRYAAAKSAGLLPDSELHAIACRTRTIAEAAEAGASSEYTA